MKKAILFLILSLAIFSGCESEKKTDKGESSSQMGEIIVESDALNITEDNLLTTYDIDGNARISISLDGTETTLTRQIGALASIKNNYEKIHKSLLAKRLSKNYHRKCSACHDDYANGVIGPSLLTKSSDEIFNMINAYKNATKVNVLMKYLVSQMSEKEIREIADEIAAFNKEVREGTLDSTN